MWTVCPCLKITTSFLTIFTCLQIITSGFKDSLSYGFVDRLSLFTNNHRCIVLVSTHCYCRQISKREDRWRIWARTISIRILSKCLLLHSYCSLWSRGDGRVEDSSLYPFFMEGLIWIRSKHQYPYSICRYEKKFYN